MSKQDELTEKQKRFLEEFAKDFFVRRAAKRTGISAQTVYDWRRSSKKFDNLMDGIKNTLVDISESVLFHTLKFGYKTDKSGNMIMVPTGKKTDIPQKDEKGELVVDSNGEIVYMDELTPIYSREAIDAAKFMLMKNKKGRELGYADTLDINADLKAMNTKILSKEEIIDVSAEDMKQMFLEDLKNG